MGVCPEPEELLPISFLPIVVLIVTAALMCFNWDVCLLAVHGCHAFEEKKNHENRRVCVFTNVFGGKPTGEPFQILSALLSGLWSRIFGIEHRMPSFCKLSAHVAQSMTEFIHTEANTKA
jgi:hypothetical protein